MNTFYCSGEHVSSGYNCIFLAGDVHANSKCEYAINSYTRIDSIKIHFQYY